jgi:UDP-glucose 4,6-dehydratase
MTSSSPRFSKRILVTGGAGFIGSHVVIHLVKTYPQYYVVNMDSLDYCSSIRNVHTAFEPTPPPASAVPVNGDSGDDVEDDELGERLRGSFCVDLHDVTEAPPPPTASDTDTSERRPRASSWTLPDNYKFIKGDITCADLVEYILQTERIDTVLHFAAQSHVDLSFRNSLPFSQTNILGTHVLLEAARVHGKIDRFIHVSTDEVYGEGQRDTAAMHEDHVLEPTNPYAATKAGAEFIVKAYQRSFQLPTIITRSNNVYGPHQYPEKLIPKLINQILRDRPVTIHGDGSHTRNYLYISDVVAAFDVILHQGEIGQVYNIGGTNEVPNERVALDLLRILKPQCAEPDAKKQWITYVRDRPFNDLRYTIDASKLRALGWQEQVSWTDGLRKTVQWWTKFGHRFPNIEHALAPHPAAFKQTYSVPLY